MTEAPRGLFIRRPDGEEDFYRDMPAEYWHEFELREGGHLVVIRESMPSGQSASVRKEWAVYAPTSWSRAHSNHVQSNAPRAGRGR